MYRVTANYIAGEDPKFDRAYYIQSHLPLAKSIFSESLNDYTFHVDWNVTEFREETERILYPCRLHILFEKEEDFEHFTVLLREGKGRALYEDQENYTNCSVKWEIAESVGV